MEGSPRVERQLESSSGDDLSFVTQDSKMCH